MKIFTQIRNSDLIFFGVLLSVTFYVIFAITYSLIFSRPAPGYEVLFWWWAILLPFALTKAYMPNSMLGIWLERKPF